MSQPFLTVTCTACAVTNRIPTAKAGLTAKCGKCGATLPLVYPDFPVAVGRDEFSQEVLSSPLPVLVDFWAPWCGPCRSLAPSLEHLAKEYAGHLKIVKVNTDDHPGMGIAHNFQSIPTMILFDQGRVKDRITGALPLGQLRNWIKRAMGWL